MAEIMYHYIDILVVAMISTAGAFVPVFILMIIHYFVRKNEYRKQVQRYNVLIKEYESLIKINDKAIQTIYQSVGVKNGEELFKKMRNVSISASKYFELTDFIRKNLEQKIENQDKMNKMSVKKISLDSYNFGTYVSNLLDKRFIE